MTMDPREHLIASATERIIRITREYQERLDFLHDVQHFRGQFLDWKIELEKECRPLERKVGETEDKSDECYSAEREAYAAWVAAGKVVSEAKESLEAAAKAGDARAVILAAERLEEARTAECEARKLWDSATDELMVAKTEAQAARDARRGPAKQLREAKANLEQADQREKTALRLFDDARTRLAEAKEDLSYAVKLPKTEALPDPVG
jgi:hypothetical protein